MKVYIRHYRKQHPKFKNLLKDMARDRRRLSKEGNPIWSSKCNGVTEVTVVDDSGREATGYACCDPRDIFIKKEGVLRAKGRAQKKLTELIKNEDKSK